MVLNQINTDLICVAGTKNNQDKHFNFFFFFKSTVFSVHSHTQTIRDVTVSHLSRYKKLNKMDLGSQELFCK